MVALAAVGTAVGAAAATLTVSLVQAEDDAGIRSFQRQEYERRQGGRETVRAAYTSTRATSYAPSRGVLQMPLFGTRADGRLAHPPVELNPFRQRRPAPAQTGERAPREPTTSLAALSASTQTFCVRMCDGFHAPIGRLQRSADFTAHEAICKAMNPGIPVKVFRLPAGATSIEAAVSVDGRTYGSLPIAFGHEKSADPACRPAVVAAGQRRVSLLRDFTLRPGDSVVLDGRVRTFTGSASWPYSEADFKDFRRSEQLSAANREAIDAKLGLSQAEASMRALRRQMRVREAALRDDGAPLRGALGPEVRTAAAPRIIMSSPYIAEP